MKLRFRSVDRTVEVPDGLLSDPTVELDPAEEPVPPEPQAAEEPVPPGPEATEAEVVPLRPLLDTDRAGPPPQRTGGGTEPEVPSEDDEPAGTEGEPPAAGAESPAPMDPRLRARRIAIQRARGRRRLNRVIAVVAGVALSFVGWVATRTPFLDVDRVAVAGAVRTPAEEIRVSAAIPDDQALLDVDLEAVEDRVDRLPWVAGVEATRHWPNTVVIRVEERVPVAVAPVDPGGWAVLSADGRVMEIAATAPAGLVPLADVEPVVAAGAPLPAVTRDALEVARVIPPSLLPRVAAIAPVGEREYELRLVPSGVVRLGPATDVVDKIIAAHTVLSQTSEWCVGELDVAVPTAPVLTPTAQCG